MVTLARRLPQHSHISSFFHTTCLQVDTRQVRLPQRQGSFNSLSSSASQAASFFFLRSSDMYAYSASQLDSAYDTISPLQQSHLHQIFLKDHSLVNRQQYSQVFVGFQCTETVQVAQIIFVTYHTLCGLTSVSLLSPFGATIYNVLSFCFSSASTYLFLLSSPFQLLSITNSSEGRVFQNVGASTEKDLALYVLKLKRGIKRRFLDDERSLRDRM